MAKRKKTNALTPSGGNLIFPDQGKEKPADELIIANIESTFNMDEKEKEPPELFIADAKRQIMNNENGKREIVNKELEEAKGKAERATRIADDAVKAKQQFLSNMSHEIRTPMNAIIGFTKVVLRTELTEKQKEYLNAIKISGDALIALINDILDLAKVDAGKMSFERTPFKMETSITAMFHLFEPRIREKNLRLRKEYDNNIPEILIGDPVRLNQIILNLLNNAVKFTSEGNIILSARLLNEDDGKAEVEFSVRDTGIGIAHERITTVFENFQQANSSLSRLYGGTGLGLAIVKQLVEAQGGKVKVQSKLNEGSTFSFTLRFQKTVLDLSLEGAKAELDKKNKNIKILVVEDVPLNQLLMKTLLEDAGFGCDIAGNGKLAVERLKTHSYDVILMDLQMPEMNGFEATEYIRKNIDTEIPIVALSADVTTVDLAKCKAVGMNDYLTKPVNESLLFDKIVSLVKKKVPIEVVENTIYDHHKTSRCVDLGYLDHLTKSNPVLMSQMISLYLEQTPPLIRVMKKSLAEKDWDTLRSAAHKMIPSFSIMGINVNFENIAKMVQGFAGTEQQVAEIPNLVLQLENVCSQACGELEEEIISLKNVG